MNYQGRTVGIKTIRDLKNHLGGHMKHAKRKLQNIRNEEILKMARKVHIQNPE